MFDLRDAAALAGVALVALGLYLAWAPLAFIAVGLALLLIAQPARSTRSSR